jgi:dihydroxyacetone kinase-like predicted kinase
VRVIRTESIQAGLAAAVAFDASRGVDENAAEMTSAVESVGTGAVTVASKDALLNGLTIRKGAFLGLVEGEPVAQAESFDEVAHEVVRRLLAEPRSIVTLLTGSDRSDVTTLVGALEREHPGVELEVHEGGQPHYALLIAAE